MSNHPPQIRSNTLPGEVPGGLDVMAVGQSIFGPPRSVATPDVPGYGDLEFHAEGGLGRVWRARRLRDGLPVALKIAHATDPETAERLVVEAETLRGLDHPNIVALLEVAASASGDPVLVMEFVEGPSLTALLPDVGLEFDHALQVFLPVLSAVAHAHAQGIIHRDLKPSNILMAADGTPKVCDFGLAQPVQQRRLAFSMTRSGVLAGTVEYLAPECYERDAGATRETDLFALGIIFYELLAGRPPRGDWRRLSEIKKLDVRLDDVFAEAIHPDPTHRLDSAEAFRRRLQEIRDSRPRYAGTPMVTRAVKAADALWTGGGLYFLAAGFCSLQRVNNTDVPAVFDLTFGHTRMLGGFWALWVLIVGMGMMWAWQAARVWRFRGVPLREALPSPFGLKFGSSRGAASLVAVVQGLCAWLPLAYIAWLYAETWVWATPATPFWEKALAVTRWGSETPISPWTWDPRGFVDGGFFWIREVQPGVSPGTWRLHDRQSFFIFTQPLLMATGAVAIAVGIGVTVVAVLREWKGHHPARRWLFMAALAGSGIVVNAEVQRELKDKRTDRVNLERSVRSKREYAIKAASPILVRAAKAIYDAGGAEPDLPVEFFAPRVESGPDGPLTREAFLGLLRVERQRSHALQRHAECLRRRVLNFDDVGPWVAELHFEGYTHRPDGPCTGTYFRVVSEAAISGIDGSSQVHRWEPASTLLYTSAARELAPPEAAAWLAAFLAALNTPSSQDLEAFFLPVVLLIEPSDSRHYSPGPRNDLIRAFRAGLARRSQSVLAPASPVPALRSMTGGRWEVASRIVEFDDGDDRSTRAAARSWSWQIEVVFTGGRWQVLKIRM